MARSIMFYRVFLLLVCITQLAVSLSVSSRAAGVLTLTLSLAPLTLAAEGNDETAADDADATDAATAKDESKECNEPGACDDNENVNVDNTITDASSTESETNSVQTSDWTPPIVTATKAPNGDRIITHEELALHTEGGDAGIWLSILGRIYDVSTGTDFYHPDKGTYSFYAGRDASSCFSSGKNNLEGAGEKLEEWDDIKLLSVYEWGAFYEHHEIYQYLGVLAGSRFFDEIGEQTQLRKDIMSRASAAQLASEEKRALKKKERNAAREAKKKKKAGGK